MSDTFKTINTSTEGIYKEKGSKFLSFAIPVRHADEVKEIVKEYRKRYFDARHVCYAYMLGHEHKEFRANDDGEPSGTAGRPILGQINSRELTDILVIVVRYFGGVLLGTGGLVVAYKEATADALMNDVMRIIKDTNPQIVNQTFDNQCTMELSIRKQDAPVLVAKLEKIIGLVIED